MPPESPRVVAYGSAASIVDGLGAGVAAVLRDAVVHACATEQLVVTDVVVGARSVVVMHDSGAAPAIREILQHLSTHFATQPSPRNGSTIDIAVRFDGADLREVAEHCGLSVNEVVALHSGAKYVVEFCGFSPGFAYLAGLPTSLHLPRRATPRPRVPRGAVAIAATYSAVYPRESPGGWHLIGTTTHELWDISRTPPAALVPGTSVRFVHAP